MAKFLADSFPELRGDGRITGGLYPAPPLAAFLTHAVSALQLLALAWMLVGGSRLFRALVPGYRTTGRPLPAWYWTVQDNPVPIAIFLFLLAPQLVAKMQASGAFEIYLDHDDTAIFSKLQTGALPTVEQLLEPLVAAGLARAGAQ